jgi:hypothetical protein
MPPTLADLQTAISELRTNLHESGPIRFKNKAFTGHLINYLEANVDDILDAITESSTLETESTTACNSQFIRVPRNPDRVILYLAAEEWAILEETLRMDSESSHFEPEERRRILNALNSVGVVSGMEVKFEPSLPTLDQIALAEGYAGHRANGGDYSQALKSVRFLPVRFGTEEIAVAVVTARVTPDLVNQTHFLEALKRAVTDWVCDTEAGRSLLEFSSGNLNIGDLASHGIDEPLAQRLATHGIHDLNIDDLLAHHRWQAWLFEEGLLRVIPDEEAETGS